MLHRYASSDDTHAMVARIAPVVLELLSDGLPRSRNEIVEALADDLSADDVLTPILEAVPVPSVPLRERPTPADHGRSGWPGQPA